MPRRDAERRGPLEAACEPLQHAHRYAPVPHRREGGREPNRGLSPPGFSERSVPTTIGKLNPFRKIPNPREVWAWGMYDFANQSFTLLIITMLFSLYVKQVVSPHPPEGAAAEALRAADRAGAWNWSLMHGGSLVLVVILSPLMGALADARGWRRQVLMGTGLVCVLLTLSLASVGPGMLLLAALLYVPANICYQIGENFLASFLPRISSPRTIGRVSAIGWSMGYLGALALLLCVVSAMVAFGWEDPRRWRPFFVFAGLWFAIGMLPAALFLRGDEPDPSVRRRGILRDAVSRIVDTGRHAREFRQLGRFLLAFFVYGFGVQVIIGFASIIAGDFGFERENLVLFGAQITLTAGAAALLTGRFQDRIGARATVIIYLCVWIVSSAGLVTIKLVWPEGGPSWPVWLVGNGLGFGLGGIGTSSRSMVARFAPRHRAAEFFGFWGVSYKLAGAVGVLSFGAVTKLFGELWSLVLLLSFFVVGLILVLRVNETAGVRAAKRAERAHHRR